MAAANNPPWPFQNPGPGGAMALAAQYQAMHHEEQRQVADDKKFITSRVAQEEMVYDVSLPIGGGRYHWYVHVAEGGTEGEVLECPKIACVDVCNVRLGRPATAAPPLCLLC